MRIFRFQVTDVHECRIVYDCYFLMVIALDCSMASPCRLVFIQLFNSDQCINDGQLRRSSGYRHDDEWSKWPQGEASSPKASHFVYQTCFCSIFCRIYNDLIVIKINDKKCIPAKFALQVIRDYIHIKLDVIYHPVLTVSIDVVFIFSIHALMPLDYGIDEKLHLQNHACNYEFKSYSL